MKVNKHLEKVIVLSLALMSLNVPALAADYNNTTAGTQTYPVAVNVTDADTTSTVGGYTTRISASGSGVISTFQDTVTSTVDIPAASALNYAGAVTASGGQITAKSIMVQGTNAGGNYIGVLNGSGSNLTVSGLLDAEVKGTNNVIALDNESSNVLTLADVKINAEKTSGSGSLYGIKNEGSELKTGNLDVTITDNAEATNGVYGISTGSHAMTTNGNVTVNVTAGKNNEAYGITDNNNANITGDLNVTVNNGNGTLTRGAYVNNTITVGGNATFNIIGGTQTDEGLIADYLNVAKNLIVTLDGSKNTNGHVYGTNSITLHVAGDATVDVIGGTTQTTGISTSKGLTIDGNAKVTVNAPNGKGGSCGLLADYTTGVGSVVVGKNADISVTGGSGGTAGIYAPVNIQVNGSTNLYVDGSNDKSDEQTQGIYAGGGNITLGGPNTLNVKVGSGSGFALGAGGDITVNGTLNDTITATNATSFVQGVRGHKNVTFNDAATINVTGGNSTGSVLGVLAGSPPKGVTRVDATLTANSTLNITVNNANSSGYAMGISANAEGNAVVLNGETKINAVSGSGYGAGIITRAVTTEAPLTIAVQGNGSVYGINGSSPDVKLYDTTDIAVTGGSGKAEGLFSKTLETTKALNVNVDATTSSSARGIANTGTATTNGPVNVTVTANPAVGGTGINATGTYTANDTTTVTVNNGGIGINVDGTAANATFNNTTVNVNGGSSAVGIQADNGADVDAEGTTIVNSKTALQIGGGDATLTVNKSGNGTTQLTGDLVGSGNASASVMDVSLDNGSSFLTGTVTKNNQAINLGLSNGSVWNVTGTSTLTNLVNNSTVNMRYTGNGATETITVDNLSGNGTFLMNPDLQTSYDSKNVQRNSDKIIITTSSSGNYLLDLRDASLDQNIASQGYLLLVEDQSNGSATFTGTDVVHGGIFKYKPIILTDNPTDYSGFNANAKNWYLTGFERTNKVSDNTKATLGLGETRYAGYLMDNDTLLKRLGELRTIKGEPEENGIWARYRHGSMSGDSFSGGFTMVQVGYDKKTSNKRYTGLAFNHTSSSYDFAAGDGEGSQDALTVYNTWLGDKNHYFDIVGKIGKMRGNSTYVDSLYPEKGNYDNWFASISGEYGRKNINDKNGWYYEPQVQLTLGRIRGADYTTSLGTKVELGSITSLIGRAGVTVGKEYNMKDANKHSNIYAKLNWLHEFKGDANIGLRDSYGDTYDTTKDYGGSWWNAGIGATINVNKNTHMYLDFEKNFGGEVTTNWIGQLGCQWTWK